MCPAGREMATAYGRAKSNSVPPTHIIQCGKNIDGGKVHIFTVDNTFLKLFVLVTFINTSIYVKNLEI